MTTPVSAWKVCAVFLLLAAFSGSVLAADSDLDSILSDGQAGDQLMAPVDSNCFVSHGGAGCDDAICESTVCAVDSFCCNVAWDGICAAEAVEMCEVDGEIESDIARFPVGVSFSDGNTMEVEVNITCTGGLPLTQSFNISSGRGVAFTLEAFQDGQPTCTITEIAPAGYDVVYVPNQGTANPDGCTFTGVELRTTYACSINHVALPVDVTVDAVWASEGQGSDIEQTAYASLDCSNVASGQSYWEWNIDGETSYTASVAPMPDGSTSCDVSYGTNVSGVEGSGCEEPISVNTGDTEQSCTITFTVFFEGIPTINQYGMALLVLLMLGVGFVGFRRLV